MNKDDPFVVAEALSCRLSEEGGRLILSEKHTCDFVLFKRKSFLFCPKMSCRRFSKSAIKMLGG